MCGLSSASQKRRNGHNARLKTTSCGRHDVRVGDGGALSTILTQNRYALYLPRRAAPSAMHRQTGRTEKAHLHVRFIVSKSETQKRPQRASHNAQLRSPRRAWEMEALCRRSSPKTATRCTSRSEPRLLLCTGR